MALIRCSNCGGQISDTAAICPHCGLDLGQERLKEQITKEYGALPKETQAKLRVEYDEVCPNLTIAEKKQKILSMLYNVLIGSATALLLIIGLLHFLKVISVFIITIVALALVFVIIIIACAVYFYLKFFKKERLKELKNFQNWLYEEKRITYHLALNEKEKRIFDSLNTEGN